MKIPPAGADLIHEDRLGEFAKSSKNVQMGLHNNYPLKTVNFTFLRVRSETLLYILLYLNVLPFH